MGRTPTAVWGRSWTRKALWALACLCFWVCGAEAQSPYVEAMEATRRARFEEALPLWDRVAAQAIERLEWGPYVEAEGQKALILLYAYSADSARRHMAAAGARFPAAEAAADMAPATLRWQLQQAWLARGAAQDSLWQVARATWNRLNAPGPALRGRYAWVEGDIALRQQRYPEALTALRQAHTILTATTPEETELSAQVEISLGDYFYAQRQADSAIHHYQLAAQKLAHIYSDQHPLPNKVRMGLARAFRLKEDYESAQDHLSAFVRATLRVFGPEHPDLGSAYGQLALVQYYLGDPYKALQYYQQALRIYQRTLGPHHRQTGFTYQGLGMVSNDMGQHEEALNYYKDALEIIEDAYGPQHLYVAYLYNNLGSTYNYLKDYPSALSAFEQTLKIYQQQPQPNQYYLSFTYNNLGLAHHRQKAYSQAVTYYQLAIQTIGQEAHRPDAESAKYYANLALTYTALKEYEAAFDAVDQGIQSLCFPYYSFRPNQLPPPSAVSNMRVYLLLLKSKAMAQEGAAQATPGQEAAYTTYRYTLHVLDSLWRNSHLEETQLFYQKEARDMFERCISLAHTLYQSSEEAAYLDAGFRFAEKSSNVQLAAHLSMKSAQKAGIVPAGLIRKEEEISNGVRKVQLNLAQLQADPAHHPDSLLAQQEAYFFWQSRKDSLVRLLMDQYPLYFRLRYQMPEISLTSAREALKDDQGLIRFFNGDSALYVMGITRDTSFWLKKPLSPGFQDSLEVFIQNLWDIHRLMTAGKQTFEQFKDQAYHWYQYLLGEVLPAMQVSHLVIVPDGVLGYLPFETLLNRSAEDADTYAQLPFLIKDYQVRYAYAAHMLPQRNISGPSAQYDASFLGFAPSYPGPVSSEILASRYGEAGTWPSLQFNQQEVIEAQEIWGGKIFTGQAANKSRFWEETGSQQILHLACHGIFNDTYPMLSGLVLYPGEGGGEAVDQEDPILYPHELYQAGWQTELAVLSACNTGQGKWIKGEGIQSLARSFSIAGCKNLLFSLWPADDEASFELITEFFHFLKEGQGKDEALRAAKLRQMQRVGRGHPYFWATFIYMGDDQPIGQQRQKLPWVPGLWLLGLLLGVYFLLRMRRSRNLR